MTPYLPVVALSRSQSVRIGGHKVPALKNSQGALTTPAYVDLGDTKSRRDLENHSAIGAVVPVGTATTSYSTTNMDVIVPTGGAVSTTSTTSTVLNVAAGTVSSRLFGGTLSFASTSVTLAGTGTGSRTDRVVINGAGQVSVAQGTSTTATTGSVEPAIPAGTSPLAKAVVVSSSTTEVVTTTSEVVTA